MIVVADTTPIRYLVAIKSQHLLRALYGRVLIPPGVAAELSHASAPAVVRAWMSHRPEWVEIRRPRRQFEPEMDLDAGEREAIALAQEVGADLLLLDEWDGRAEAARMGLRVAGTLRVLVDGASLGLTDLEASFDLLRGTNFRVSSKLLDSLLEEFRRSKP